MKKTILILSIVFLLISCAKAKNKAILQGKVENEQIAIVSKIPGKIVQLLVKEGDFVKKVILFYLFPKLKKIISTQI